MFVFPKQSSIYSSVLRTCLRSQGTVNGTKILDHDTENVCSFTKEQKPFLNNPGEDHVHSLKSGVREFSEIPGPRGIYRLPIIGTMLSLEPFTRHKLSHLHLFFHELHKTYGKMVRFTLGAQEGVILFDPLFIDQAIRHEGQYPQRIGLPILTVYSKRNNYASFSIRQGEDWHVHRKALQHGMSRHATIEKLNSNLEIAKDLVTEIEKFKNIPCQNMKRILMAYATETGSDIIFSKRLHVLGKGTRNDPECELFLDSVTEMFQVIAETFYACKVPTFMFFRTPLYNRFERATNNVIRFCQARMKEAEDEMKNDENSDDNNLLKRLYADDTINGNRSSISSVVSGSLFGGIEMISQGLTWFFRNMGLFPDAQEKLYREILDKCGKDGDPTDDIVGHMPYLKACVKESFRLIFPTANGSMRVMPEEIVIDNYRIPKGTYVFFGHNTLCQSSEYFENPQDFIPERWTTETNSYHKRLMSLCVLAFGHGARNCVGRRVAEQQMYLAIIKILQKLKITVPESAKDVDIFYTVTAVCKDPINLQFNHRE